MSQQATYVWETRMTPTGEVARIYAYALLGQALSEAAIGIPQRTLISLEGRGARQVLRQQLGAVEDVAAPANPEQARLWDMARRGEIVLGRGGMPEGFWDMPRPEDPRGLVRQAIREDRDSGL